MQKHTLVKIKSGMCLAMISVASASFAQQRIEVNILSHQPTLLSASAGSDANASSGNVLLGGSPTAAGGTEPYTYQWIPSVGLNDSTIPNPEFSGVQEQTYELVITDSRGCMASDTVAVTFVGVNEILEQTGILIYPNPGTGLMRIEIGNTKLTSASILYLFDAQGKLLQSKSLGSMGQNRLLDLEALPAGTYTISIVEGAKKYTNTFIIKR
jgi:hypothetical protein